MSHANLFGITANEWKRFAEYREMPEMGTAKALLIALEALDGNPMNLTGDQVRERKEAAEMITRILRQRGCDHLGEGSDELTDNIDIWVLG